MHDSFLVTRDVLVQNIVAMMSKGTATRILIKAPPFSGKTSILQMFIRSTQRVFEIVYISGLSHGEEDSATLLNKIKAALVSARKSAEGRQIALIIDDCQILCRDAIISSIVKYMRDVHLLAAASYFIPTDGGSGRNDTPAEFNQIFLGTELVGITRQQCTSFPQQIRPAAATDCVMSDEFFDELITDVVDNINKRKRDNANM